VSAGTRWAFRGAASLVFLFLYLPLFLIVLYAFNKTNINAWPFPGFSTRWFEQLAFAFARYRFFGREGLNFVVTLPIILPGAITGVALASFFLFVKEDLSMRTVIVGHTTFCIVVVFNNVLARLRRVARSMEEASADLGASAWQTFRYVTFPTIRTALVAGALLAFALSFDEIAVTFFLAGADTETLPLWVLGQLRQTQSLPEVNAVAAVILLISLPLIAISAYLMRDEGAAGKVVQGE
jgi:putative spermidine/putrescine transport system permease protein